jgi:hypothetical protein
MIVPPTTRSDSWFSRRYVVFTICNVLCAACIRTQINGDYKLIITENKSVRLASLIAVSWFESGILKQPAKRRRLELISLQYQVDRKQKDS